MSFMKKMAGIAVAAGLGLAAYAPANAATVLVFGQQLGGSPVTATALAGTTTITFSDVPVLISTFDGAPSAISAFATANFVSTGAAMMAGPVITQEYGGSITFTSGIGGSGTLFLDAIFAGGAFFSIGAGSSEANLAASQPPSALVTFTSGVIPPTRLELPRGMSLSFTDVTPGVNICGGTICSFTSNVAGTFSAQAAVPTPAALALFGVALVGLAGAQRMRRKA